MPRKRRLRPNHAFLVMTLLTTLLFFPLLFSGLTDWAESPPSQSTSHPRAFYVSHALQARGHRVGHSARPRWWERPKRPHGATPAIPASFHNATTETSDHPSGTGRQPPGQILLIPQQARVSLRLRLLVLIRGSCLFQAGVSLRNAPGADWTQWGSVVLQMVSERPETGLGLQGHLRDHLGLRSRLNEADSL